MRHPRVLPQPPGHRARRRRRPRIVDCRRTGARIRVVPRAATCAAERREIEAELFAGALAGVVATNALELGVDVGGLDACVLNGFPGTIASMWQQAGRAGPRPSAASLAVLVAG